MLINFPEAKPHGVPADSRVTALPQKLVWSPAPHFAWRNQGTGAAPKWEHCK